MTLTAYVISAGDARLLVGVEEIPALRVVTSLEGIAHAVRCEASALTGRPADEFQVLLPF